MKDKPTEEEIRTEIGMYEASMTWCSEKMKSLIARAEKLKTEPNEEEDKAIKKELAYIFPKMGFELRESAKIKEKLNKIILLNGLEMPKKKENE